MKRMHVLVATFILVVLLGAVASAATGPAALVTLPCPGSDNNRARTIETISFALPYAYPLISTAYTTWYSTDLKVRSLTVVENLVFDFMPDNQVVSLSGGYDCVWAPVAGDYSTIQGVVTISGTAAVSVSNIIIQ